MNKNKVFGYVRVSTQKQGREGVSLDAQREAISRYAAIHGLEIVEWFEEQESAAKQGRLVFNRMVTALKRGKAKGFICHKLDRSVRNIHDWAALSSLTDSGIQIHFAHEALDLDSLSGKLSADIQAAIAAHYSRNLSEEVKKGINGRLKQGLYPFKAPLGYRDAGGGKAKTIDPVIGPIVRKAFEWYATGEYTFESLRPALVSLGLRSVKGGNLTKNNLTAIFNNPFYYGVIRVRDRETYSGIHTPLITKSLFDRCQDVLHGRTRQKILVHTHAFRRRVRCHTCAALLVGERQKEHTYYRCHNCKGVCVREEKLEKKLREELSLFVPIIDEFAESLTQAFKLDQERKQATRVQRANALKMQIGNIEGKLDRLVDALVDETLDDESYKRKRQALLDKKAVLIEQVEKVRAGNEERPEEQAQFLELGNALKTLGDSGKPDDLLRLVYPISSNLGVQAKEPYVAWVSPFREIAEMAKNPESVLRRDRSRTVKELCRLFGVHAPQNVHTSASQGNTKRGSGLV